MSVKSKERKNPVRNQRRSNQGPIAPKSALLPHIHIMDEYWKMG
ncbi:hypothetical protein AVEN_112161-1, partial [Araneus ventricosus]